MKKISNMLPNLKGIALVHAWNKANEALTAELLQEQEDRFFASKLNSDEEDRIVCEDDNMVID